MDLWKRCSVYNRLCCEDYGDLMDLLADTVENNSISCKQWPTVYHQSLVVQWSTGK